MLIVNTRHSSPVTDLMTMGYWARGTKLIKYFGRNLTSSSETDHDIGKTFMIREQISPVVAVVVAGPVCCFIVIYLCVLSVFSGVRIGV